MPTLQSRHPPRALLSVAVNWVRGRLVLHAGAAIGFQMAANLLHHLLRLPLRWFERRHLGDIVSRFGSLAPVQGLLTQGFAVALVDGVMAVTTLMMMIAYSGTLTLVVCGALLLYGLLRLATLAEYRRRQQATIAAAAEEEEVICACRQGRLRRHPTSAHSRNRGAPAVQTAR